MLDADGATKVDDVEKLEKKVCINCDHKEITPEDFLTICKSGGNANETSTFHSRSMQLQVRNLSLGTHLLVIQILEYLISQLLHLVPVLISRRRPWLQLVLLICSLLYFHCCYLYKYFN